MTFARTALIAAAVLSTGIVRADGQRVAVGGVFVATNNADGNAIIMYAREQNGELHEVGRFPTGGRGQGGINDPLESQYSVVLTADHQFLLAVTRGPATSRFFA